MRLKIALLCATLALQSFILAEGADGGFFAYRSFNPEFKAMAEFAKRGINTVALFPANTYNSLGGAYCAYPPNWVWMGKYDFSVFDRQFDDVIAVNPKAEFICIVDLNSPIFLQHRLSLNGQSAESDSFTALSNALVNKNWKKHTLDYMKALLAHAEKKYGQRIKAYLLACGQTDEWMDYSNGTFGRFKAQAWKAWRQKRGLPPAPIPSFEKMDSADFDNFLRDPSKSGDVIDWFVFSNEIVADAILDFTKAARSSLAKDKKIGVFFGYIMQLAYGRLVGAGHLFYERVFASPDIDFFISPGNYFDRQIGQGSGFMAPNGTRVRFGKSWLHEIDHITHTCKDSQNQSVPGMNRAWDTQEKTNAGLKREFALATISGASLWCFDMWGGWFNTPETMDVIEKSRQIWEKHSSKRYKGAAQIALIADPQSAFYICDKYIDKDLKVLDVYAGTRTKMNLLGAPFEIFSFDDLPHVNLDQYKFIVFPASFKITQERLKMLKEHVFKNGRTLLFAYAPGIIDGKTLDTNRVRDFAGFDYGAEGVNVSDKGDYKIAYIAKYKDITPEVLRKLAEDAGVHIYFDEYAPVFANERLLAVHTATGGKKTVRLPKKYSQVRELYSGKVVAEDADSFEYEFKKPDTALFELEQN